MRKINSKFNTNFVSESGTYLQNKDYFAFVELDQYACYVIADGIDEDKNVKSGEMAVKAFIKKFMERPTMNKFFIKKYLRDVNKIVIESSRNVRLKASITVVVSNYSKIRCFTIGNTRFYYYKDGYLKARSKDESLTQQLVDKEMIPLDKMARHIERNNLTAYLGEDKLGKIFVSKKIKLNDKDVFTLLTRGIWENCDSKEIEDALEGAKEPKDVVDNVEDIVLSKQPKDLQNYTFAAVFADKVYINPKRKKIIKMSIIIALIVILLIAVLAVIYHIRKNKKIEDIQSMLHHEANAEEYIGNGNISKAETEYKDALDIANRYKLKDDLEKLDKDYKYMELIEQADKLLEKKKYSDALKMYMTALKKGKDVKNIAKLYINEKMELTKKYIEIEDLMTLADEQLQGGDDEGAEGNYLKAKDLALQYNLYDEKKTAMEKLQKIYDDRAKANEKADADKKKADEDAKKAQEEAAKQKEADKKKAEDDKKAHDEQQSKAIDLRKNGDEQYVVGDYVSAKMYYAMAKESFEEIGDTTLADELEQKIVLMDKKITATADKKEEADKYLNEADTRYLSQEYDTAKVLYLLAKDTYADIGMTEESAKADEKLKVLEKQETK